MLGVGSEFIFLILYNIHMSGMSLLYYTKNAFFTFFFYYGT